MKKILCLVVFMNIGLFAQIQMQIPTTDTKAIKDKLVQIMSTDSFYVSDSNDYKIEFKKNLQESTGFFTNVMTRALDGTTLSESGFMFSLTPNGKYTNIGVDSYVVSKYDYGSREPKKTITTENGDWYTACNNILYSLQNHFSSMSQKKISEKKVEEKKITDGDECARNNRVWQWNGLINQWVCY